MEVNVKLYSGLKNYAPGNSNVFSIALYSGATVRDLLETLKIPDRVRRFIVVNGRRGEEDTPLSAGDTVVLFSPVEGG